MNNMQVLPNSHVEYYRHLTPSSSLGGPNRTRAISIREQELLEKSYAAAVRATEQQPWSPSTAFDGDIEVFAEAHDDIPLVVGAVSEEFGHCAHGVLVDGPDAACEHCCGDI